MVNGSAWVEPTQESEIKMTTSIQEKFNIQVIDYDFFGDEDPTIIIEALEHKFYVQTHSGKHSSSCWITTDSSDGDINQDDYADVYEEDTESVFSEIIKMAEQKANAVLRNQVIERIINADETGVIADKAAKIASIVGKGFQSDYLILASTFQNAEKIAVNDAMIMLQISLECSQQQSNDIVNLFI